MPKLGDYVCLHRSELEKTLAAMERLNEWDKTRKFIVPYRVRDPIHFSMAELKKVLAK